MALLIAALALATALGVLLGVPRLRLRWITPGLLRLIAPLLPKMSETERVALEAGTVGWDAALFSGDPDWKKLLAAPAGRLSEREKAFLEGPVRQLCGMLDDWAVTQAGDLPPEAWAFIKQQRFWGMIIPEEHGGLGFSALAHSAVVTMLSGRSVTAAVTVMVPNSLGPGELLLHYGTGEQKRHWLPRLARGEEIPCFALTEPEAGSDAASIRSEGVICRDVFEGKETLGIRLNWEKRYATLGPVATVIGLAFRLRDPEGLLGGGKGEGDLGITCALVPSNLPGIEIGSRHDPLGVPFQNGPILGRDVFVPVEAVIGGPAMAGQGWRMLMDCLSAGRAISLPSLSVGAAQLAARVAGAYALVRRQFGLPIGRFEGIEAPLARIGGMAYLLDSARTVTAAAVDAGQKPSVVSAVVKAYATEGMRVVVNDAMDILGGAGICRGPRSTLAAAYAALPIGITVEGANILTRSLIIFGQGALRCHPFAREEMEAAAAGDLPRFDRALFGHVRFALGNAARALVLGLTDGCFLPPPVLGRLAGPFGRFSRMSAAFALLADASMGLLGGQLKRRERLSGRLADALAWLYLGSTALKRFVDEGQPEKDLPCLRWSLAHCLYETQQALVGLLDNLPNRPAAWLLKLLAFPLGARYRPPADALGSAVARSLMDPEARERLTGGLFIPPPGEAGLGRLEAAFGKAVAAAEAEQKLRDAMKQGLGRAVALETLSAEERQRLEDAEAARREAIRVDAFDPEAFRGLKG